jgi:hypothetical protein
MYEFSTEDIVGSILSGLLSSSLSSRKPMAGNVSNILFLGF